MKVPEIFKIGKILPWMHDMCENSDFSQNKSFPNYKNKHFFCLSE